MSIKDLFGRNYLADSNQKDLVADVESTSNLKAIKVKQDSFLPQVDYEDPQTFARYGSANLYYKSAIDRIIDFYPYDGSDADINEFYNKSLDIEKYIFNKKYPRTTGYVNISADGWGTSTKINGYGVPSSLEYITFNGGPNVLNETQDLKKLVPDPTNSKFQYNNVYDDNLYTNNGYPSDYGEGTRLSNLRSDFDTGVTVEFWAMTGSTPAVMNPLTERQVIFDMWNNNPTASADQSYGRIRIEVKEAPASASPFLITIQSGTLSGTVEQFNTSSIGSGLDVHTLGDWKHYAFVLKNIDTATAPKLEIRLYVNGELNDTVTGIGNTAPGELTSKNMQGRIGALLTAPSKLADSTLTSTYAGGGKLSGSIDEFRFWKTARSAEEIGRYWFDQVRGGTNIDIANTTLGMYYKFNEGITQTASVDSVVLDYAGRLCNGTWTGYSSTSRNTGSAIVSASASEAEYLDPIVYATHPEVVSLKTDLLATGLYHDGQNTGQFLNLIPSWVVEEVENDGDSDLEQLAHIMGAYFDKMYLQIQALPSFRHAQYTSASHEPLPFAQHLPQSLGLITPEIFVDSKILEKFKNRTETEIFESDLNETKNLIYQNLYNNLTTIFKSKGTPRAIRNVLRCFNIDDNLVYFNTYANNQTYELNNNLKQTQKKRKMLNFNTASNTEAVMYQSADPAYSDSLGYLYNSLTGQYSGSQHAHGLTLETSIRFPKFFRTANTMDRNFLSSSLVGMQTVLAERPDDISSLTASLDVANFQIFAIRDEVDSKNVRFQLSSSYDPYPFSFELSSDTFLNVYDNQDWNLSVALKPSNYPYSDLVSGSSDYTYDVVFRGYNGNLGSIDNSFEVSSSITKGVGQSMISTWKRVYAGAQKTNITGALIHPTDVQVNTVRYWTQYLDNVSLKQHALDSENFGISGSYQHVTALDTNLDATSVVPYNLNTLALNWYFGTVTGSDGTGAFYSTDLSSGSAFVRDNFGWAGSIAGYIYPGKAHGFPASNENVVKNEIVNEFKFVDPEIVLASEMVNVLSKDDELFGLYDEVPNYIYVVEKSLYAAVTEEILDYFAGVVDFNNIIGDPVHRYRAEYKPLELLRNVFFERFNDIKTVEKFTEYFRWFDDAIANIIQQVVPASADFVGDMYNTVESHVLERNKYQSKFPTLEFKYPEPEGTAQGVGAFLLSYMTDLYGGVEASPRPTNVHKDYWKKRAQPGAQGVGSYEISSGDATVDAQRKQFRNIMWSKPQSSGSQIILSKADGTQYEKNRLLATQFGGLITLQTPTINRTIKGGVNFTDNKNIHYTYTSLYPAGPVNTSGNVFIPENVLFGDLDKNIAAIDSKAQWDEEGNISVKRRRHLGTIQGRDYDGGLGYTHTKNSYAFPFNIMSASISGGIDNLISDRVSSSITITNLHNDAYGDEMEIPMQSPFTNHTVGGHQSRHININTGTDNYRNRAEAWRILLGKCAYQSGAIGMVGPDYPWPEANAVGVTPYPMTASHKAVYYRDFIAKRPVNIRNIKSLDTTRGKTVLGNYEQEYHVLHTFGAWENPRNFIVQQPVLPGQLFQNNSTSSTQTRTILDIHRTDESHFQFLSEYSIGYLTASITRTIIDNRFSTVGGPLTDGPGYRDFRGNEYSVYNSINNRYLTVIKPSQGPSGSLSEPTGSGTAGIRVFDIHGKDYGLYSHYARHTARFGRDSLHVTGTTTATDGPGASYDQLPGFHKTHRNNLCFPKLSSVSIAPVEGDPLNTSNNLAAYWSGIDDDTILINTSSQTAQSFVSGARANGGLSYSGWMRFTPTSENTANNWVWSIGKTHNSKPMFYMEKGLGTGTGDCRLQSGGGTIPNDSGTNHLAFTLSTRSTSAATNTGTRQDIEHRAYLPISSTVDINDGAFHHIAVVMSGTNGDLSNSLSASFYVDGIKCFTCKNGTNVIQDYYDQKTSDYGTTGFLGYNGSTDEEYNFSDTANNPLALPSSLTGAGGPYRGDEFLVIGGPASVTSGFSDGFTGSMDQLSFWTRPINDTDVQELYGSGEPINILATTTYQYDTEALLAWLPLGEGTNSLNSSQGDAFAYTTGDPVFNSSSHALWDMSGKQNNFYAINPAVHKADVVMVHFATGAANHSAAGGYNPAVIPGRAGISGYTEISTYSSEPLFDNFNIQHQIPRDSRQYAWIKNSVHSTASWWHCGFTPPDYLLRSGSSYIDPINFVSASDFGSYYQAGTINKRRFGWTQKAVGEGANVSQFIPVDFVGLNTIIVENINTSSNTMGVHNSGSREGISGSLLGYFNSDITPGLLANLESTGSLFTSIILNRDGPYTGANWVRMRQGDHPILTNEKRNNRLSTMYLGNVQRNFDLPPISMKGRPAYVNLDFVNSLSTSAGGRKEQFQNVTLKTSYNNEMIGFNEWQLDNFTKLNYDSEVTPFEQLVAMKDRNNIQLNWLLYSENVFPSTRREFLSSSVTRVGYDNQFWRDTLANRVTGGMGVPNSVGVVSYADWPPDGSGLGSPAVTRFLTQSIFPLDAPIDFETRTGPPRIIGTLSTGVMYYTGSSLIGSNSAGELQNTYTFYHFSRPALAAFDGATIPLCIRNGGLYSRKHMLNSPLSTNSPSSVQMALHAPYLGQTNNGVVLTKDIMAQGIDTNNIALGLHNIETGSGEAKWEAPEQAGYFTSSNGTLGFVSASSKPWYNDYDEFRQDLKTIAKGYAVVPEFRISDQMENYADLGILGGENFDTFKIPGTALSSSQETFYKDYSNSDFLKHFADVKQMSELDAKEIKLTCHAAIKFNPYKGFYPAQRSLDLVTQFSKSFAEGFTVTTTDTDAKTGTTADAVQGSFLSQYSYARPVMQPLFAPGILYNSIKSGMAVDYPILTNGYKFRSCHITGAGGSEDYLISAGVSSANNASGSNNYLSGAFWDLRVPFEAIMNPLKSINNIELPDCEPHPSVSLGAVTEHFAARLPFTASLSTRNPGTLYTLMASNFFAEVGKFFLKDQGYTKLQSNGVNLSTFKFKEGEVYGARLRMRASNSGKRTYQFESGSTGDNEWFSAVGAKAFYRNSGSLGSGNVPGSSGSFELPQDPAMNPGFQQNFTMYSRTTAFGPPVIGREFGANSRNSNNGTTDLLALSASTTGTKDSLNGYNWSFTPPYYDGESWVDFVFRPSASINYDLQKILQETNILQRRYDPGPELPGHHAHDVGHNRRTLVLDNSRAGITNSTQNYTPYAGDNINDNAMQINSCVNLYGVENIVKQRTDKFGNVLSNENEVVGQRWVIQPKFETPMLNFSNTGLHPIGGPGSGSIAETTGSTLTLPQNFGSASVPRGMWHQFGTVPTDANMGIFMEINDIPTNWLQTHYEVVTGSSIYNNYDPAAGPDIHKSMKSFSDLMGFTNENSTVRLGDIAKKQVIKEAVVAVPYILEGLAIGETQPDAAGTNVQGRKKFINIPRKRINAAMKTTDGTVEGDSLDASGASIRKLVDRMDDYVLPPQFDFINNDRVAPIVMYMFEFEYELDTDDLSYIWQNLAPRNYKTMQLQEDSVAHELINTELLTENNLLSNPNLRWMVFKVKQRSQARYTDMIVSQVSQTTTQNNLKDNKESDKKEYPLNYNWPYDFVSIVESIKLDVDMKFDKSSPADLKTNTSKTIGKQNQTLNKKLRRKKALILNKKQKKR